MGLHLKWLIVFWLSLTPFGFGSFAKANEAVVFKKQKIFLGTKKLIVDVAETDMQHEHGLMLRKKLGRNEGMLFVFKDEQPRSFWMKNTIINLSIGYFNKNKKLIDIQEMKSTTSIMEQNLPVYPSSGPAMYALEMSEGWFKRNQIKVGAVFKFSQ